MVSHIKICTSVDIDGNNKNNTIEILCRRLAEENIVSSGSGFCEEVKKRESIFPTSIGKEIAIPHAIHDVVRTPAICFGRLHSPVLWDGKKEYVRMVILIAVPKRLSEQMHLRIISHLMRNLMHDEYIKQLLTLDEADIYRVLQDGMEGV